MSRGSGNLTGRYIPPPYFFFNPSHFFDASRQDLPLLIFTNKINFDILHTHFSFSLPSKFLCVTITHQFLKRQYISSVLRWLDDGYSTFHSKIKMERYNLKFNKNNRLQELINQKYYLKDGSLEVSMLAANTGHVAFLKQ